MSTLELNTIELNTIELSTIELNRIEWNTTELNTIELNRREQTKPGLMLSPPFVLRPTFYNFITLYLPMSINTTCIMIVSMSQSQSHNQTDSRFLIKAVTVSVIRNQNNVSP